MLRKSSSHGRRAARAGGPLPGTEQRGRGPRWGRGSARSACRTIAVDASERPAASPPVPAYRRPRRHGHQNARNSRMHQREVRSSNPICSTRKSPRAAAARVLGRRADCPQRRACRRAGPRGRARLARHGRSGDRGDSRRRPRRRAPDRARRRPPLRRARRAPLDPRDQMGPRARYGRHRAHARALRAPR